MQDTSTTSTPTTPALWRESSIAPFAGIIEQYRVGEYAALNARLLEAVATLRSEGGGLDASNRIGWHSARDLFTRPDPSFQEISGLIKVAAVQYIKRYWSTFDPTKVKFIGECWANVNGVGAFNVPHAHNQYHISGCYYVAIPEQSDPWSGIIEFLSPHGALSPSFQLGKKMMPEKFRIKPENGLMLFFPSYLKHWVYPNLENEERVSLAFNVSALDDKDASPTPRAAAGLIMS